MTRRWDVVVTEAALADVREAALYMQDQLASPAAASRFVDEFEKRVDDLAAMPEGRAPVSDFELARLGYRWCLVGKFMMFCRTFHETQTAIVDRVLYGSSDWKSLL